MTDRGEHAEQDDTPEEHPDNLGVIELSPQAPGGPPSRCEPAYSFELTAASWAYAKDLEHLLRHSNVELPAGKLELVCGDCIRCRAVLLEPVRIAARALAQVNRVRQTTGTAGDGWLIPCIERAIDALLCTDLSPPHSTTAAHAQFLATFGIGPGEIADAERAFNGLPPATRRLFVAVFNGGLSLAECVALGYGNLGTLGPDLHCAIHSIILSARRQAEAQQESPIGT